MISRRSSDEGEPRIFTRRQLLKYGAGAGVALYIPWELGTRAGDCSGADGPDPVGDRDPAVPAAAHHPAGDADSAGAQQRRRRRVLTRSPSGSSSSSPPRRAADDDGVGLRLRSTPQGPSTTRRSRSRRIATARPGQVDQRPGGRGRQLPPHLLPIDQTLHWATRPAASRAAMGTSIASTPASLHGPGSDRHPPARPTPARRATASRGLVSCPRRRTSRRATRRSGRGYDKFRAETEATRASRGRRAAPSSSTTTTSGRRHLVPRPHARHDATNVYAGPAGFYLLRGGPGDCRPEACFRGPAPGRRRRCGHEVLRDPSRDPGPLLQRRRLALLPGQPRVLRGLNQPPTEPDLDIPFIPDRRARPQSDISPIWNPEFFGAHGRQRPHLALPQGRAAPLPVPLPQRLQLALPDPQARDRR